MSTQKMISEPNAADGTLSAAEPTVEWRLDGNVAVLTMRHRPHNLLDPTLCRYIIDAMAWAGTSGARAVLLRSGVRHFSAGAELDQMLAAADEGEGVLDWPLLETLRALEDLPLPIVAAVHGTCVGGGLELALACDLTVVSESAKIGCVEASVGLHPLMGGIQRIAQRAGVARAKEMAMLGRRYDARTLERWGIFNRVVADESLEAASLALARELAGGPTIANGATKKLANVAVNEGVRAADEAMAELQRPILTSADFRTGASSIKVNGPGMARFEGR